MDESPFSLNHLPGIVAIGYLGIKEMLRFLEKIWPKNGHSSQASAAFELRLGEVVRAEIRPLQEDIRGVDDKLDKHIQWHLEKGA